MTRTTLMRLIAAVLVLTAVISVVMVQIDWNGPAGATEANDVDTLLDVMIILSAFVYSIVLVMLGYSIWRYRAKPGDESDGLEVNVTAQQFAWHFEYPDQGVTSTELHVPVDRQTEFNLKALDVIHSFWVPEWRVKKDAVPGQPTSLVATPDTDGNYELICTELCGIGHSTMRAPVIVESQEDFDKWIEDQGGKPGGQAAAPPGGAAEGSLAAEGKQIFDDQGCSGCHTLKAAGATETVGPDLDEVLADKDPQFIEESIVDPDAELAPGFAQGIMPDNFADSLSPEQLDTLVKYLSQSTQG